VLDLYEGVWFGTSLRSSDFVLSADEKTSIQARRRVHPTLPPGEGRAMRVEHGYERKGAWAYLAAWDVRRGKVYGRCEQKTRIVPFDRLVAQVMRRELYRSASRVFWIVDNGSSHRGYPSRVRLQSRWPNLILVHLPVHASWLNQVEIYSSVVERKLLTPNDFRSLRHLRSQLLQFQTYYEAVAKPFQWKFTRQDLEDLMKKIHAQQTPRVRAA
jgi:hypothetical protein